MKITRRKLRALIIKEINESSRRYIAGEDEVRPARDAYSKFIKKVDSLDNETLSKLARSKDIEDRRQVADLAGALIDDISPHDETAIQMGDKASELDHSVEEERLLGSFQNQTMWISDISHIEVEDRRKTKEILGDEDIEDSEIPLVVYIKVEDLKRHMRATRDSRDLGSEFRIEIHSEKGKPNYADISGETLDTHMYLTGDHDKDVDDIIEILMRYLQ